MLNDIRVLELSAPTTMMAGRILADLGADVITVEPPEGAAGRRLRPFVDDRPGLENSLAWHALNQNKRSVTLRPRHPDTQEILQALVDQSDIVIEWLEHKDESQLETVSTPSSVIHTVIRPFRVGSAKEHYEVTDPVLAAAGGAPAMIGTLDHAPLFCPVPQNMMDTGAEAAVASLMGLAERDRHGEAKDVEVLARIASMMPSLGRMLRHAPRMKRAEASGRVFTGLPVIPTSYKCADGLMVVSVPVAPAFKAMSKNITAWMAEVGTLPQDLADLDWIQTIREIGKGEKPKSLFERYLDALTQACLKFTKMELLEISRTVGFLAAPIFTAEDIQTFEHYQKRNFFADTRINDKTVKLPYRFAQYNTYEIAIQRPAPKLSEHTFDVLTQDVGLSTAETQSLFAHGLI